MTQTDTELMTRAHLYHGDGLIDLAFGLIVLSLGLAELFGWEISFLPIFIILFIPLERALKQRITVRRLRTVPFVPPPNLV
jgi:prepilin signal peptidase PulO-like enzyme (type II secretory pathway)